MARVTRNRRLPDQIADLTVRGMTVVGEAYIADVGVRHGGQGGLRTGVHYRGLPNRSSAPGQPPAIQSNQLQQRRGIKVNRSGDAIEVLAGSNVPYSKWLERGTSKMAPRPLWRPSWDHGQARYGRLLASVTKRGVTPFSAGTL